MILKKDDKQQTCPVAQQQYRQVPMVARSFYTSSLKYEYSTLSNSQSHFRSIQNKLK